MDREEALIFSAWALAIGGALGEASHASGSARLVHNASVTIESLGDLRIAADELRNSNEHFADEMGGGSSQGRQIVHQVDGRAHRSGEVLLVRNDEDGQSQWLRLLADAQFLVPNPARPPRRALFGEVDDKYLLLPSERYPFDRSAPPAGSWRCRGPPTRRLAYQPLGSRRGVRAGDLPARHADCAGEPVRRDLARQRPAAGARSRRAACPTTPPAKASKPGMARGSQARYDQLNAEIAAF